MNREDIEHGTRADRGLFIVMEGPDGSGKTTQIEQLSEYLTRLGRSCLITREPGGTGIGEQIRQVILDPDNKGMSEVTEMLLYAAARAQLMKEKIVPAIEAGQVVLSDRFLDSSLVYQGIARGLGVDAVRMVNALGIGSFSPDLVIFLDLPEEEGIRRKKGQKQLDRMEQESLDFHRKVAEGYRTLAKRDPERIKTIDATLPVDTICDMIKDKVQALLS